MRVKLGLAFGIHVFVCLIFI